MLDWDALSRLLKRHDIAFERPLAASYEGLVIGNADMGATIYGPPERLVFRLGKMDLWDARWNADYYQHPLSLSQLKEFVYERSQGLAPQQRVPMELNDSWQGHGRLYPCLRTGADLVVRVAQNVPGYPSSLDQRLQLADGSYHAEFALGWWQPLPRIRCQAFVSWQHNVLAIRFTLDSARLGRNLVVGLWRDPLGGRDWEMQSSQGALSDQEPGLNRRDPRQDMLPPAELEVSGSMASLWQVIPGDEYAPERGFAVAARCAEGVDFLMEPSGQAIVEGVGQEQLTLFVAMASEFEAPDARGRAAQLVDQAVQAGFDALCVDHAAGWQDYWQKSCLELEDRDLEREWYHSIYALGINARSGRPAPPLFGVSTICDCPPWRGDRHNNWPEFSNRFWGAFVANRREQALNYSEFVHGYLPTARRIAREVFEVEEGAVYPHCYIDGTSMYYFHSVWGYSLYVTAVHAQNCWWHYQYFGDKAFLRDLAYPVMCACADFFVSLQAKNPPGDYAMWPTIAAEIRGWTRNFELNKDCVEDLAHIKFLLRATIEAAEILDVDAPKRARWQDLLEHLAPYPTLTVDGKEEFVDFAGQHERPEYNCSVPLTPIFPGEDPDVLRDTALRRIALNTATAGIWQDKMREAVCLIRLGLQDHFWQRLPTCLAEISPWYGLKLAHHGPWSQLVNELLLSSWDGVVRLFPCWPLEKYARFCDLRAKGAFLVSASCDQGRVRSATIVSERGGPITLQAPWSEVLVLEAGTNRAVTYDRTGDLLSWDTREAETYLIQERGV